MMSTSRTVDLPHSLKRERDDEGATREMIEMEMASSSAAFRATDAAENNTQSPPRSRSSSLSDLGDEPVFPTTSNSAAPTAFDIMNGPPPAKKPKLTFQEREQEKAFKLIEKQNKEREKLVKEREKAEDKARKAAEKEAERKKKDEERQAKEEEKKKALAEKEEKRIAKEQEKQRKAAEQQRVEDEKKKKDAGQKKLSAFFGAPSQPKPKPIAVAGMIVEETPKTKELSEYEKVFPPFWFNTEHTTVAPVNRFARDTDASQNLHTRLDTCITTPQPTHTSFNAASLFHISSSSRPRGRYIRSVKEIMAELAGSSQRPIDLTASTSTSQNNQNQNNQNGNILVQLRAIPMKILKFHEDVRPPYIGTRTSLSREESRKLARNPFRKQVETLDYEYDSEAEWMEPEEGEELLSGDEEEEDDEDEEMDDFLDDSEAPLSGLGGLARANVAHNTEMEVESTGLCWEDEEGKNPNEKLYALKLEILNHEKFRAPIDPYSTSYWTMPPPRRPLSNKATNAPIPPLPSDPFAASKASSTASSLAPSTASDPKEKLIRPEDLPAFREVIDGSNLSQVGLIEVLHAAFGCNTKAVVKNTLLRIAAKEKGKGGVWRLTS